MKLTTIFLLSLITFSASNLQANEIFEGTCTSTCNEKISKAHHGKIYAVARFERSCAVTNQDGEVLFENETSGKKIVGVNRWRQCRGSCTPKITEKRNEQIDAQDLEIEKELEACNNL